MKLKTFPNLADEMGYLLAKIAPYERRVEEIKQQVKDGEAELIVGQHYQIKVVAQMRTTLEADKVRALLTPQQIEAVTKVTPVVQVRCQALKA